MIIVMVITKSFVTMAVFNIGLYMCMTTHREIEFL